MFQVEDKIRNCHQELRKWSRNNFEHITRELKRKIEMLRVAKEEPMCGGDHGNVLNLRKEVQFLLSQEECMWRQSTHEVAQRW